VVSKILDAARGAPQSFGVDDDHDLVP
jgi:hypothetical protein